MKLLTKVLCMISFFLLASCSKLEEIKKINGYAQGTTWHVSVWKEGGVNTQQLQGEIQKEFNRLDSVLSNYRSDSVIEGFNNNSTTDPIEVGSEIVNLVRVARGVSQASGGCYDLTVRPLFELWGFSDKVLTPPEEAKIQGQLEKVGFDKLLTISDTALRKQVPLLRVDLSSIAQGYSVHRIAEIVERYGIQNYLVEIGGELQTRGQKPDGSSWRIGIERPLPGGHSVQKAITIKQTAPLSVMTSGTYRHYFDESGRRYSHIIDAVSGQPVDHSTVSVTVIHDNPTVADAWSTALLCMGYVKGARVAEKNDIAAFFINETGDGLIEAATPNWIEMETIEVH